MDTKYFSTTTFKDLSEGDIFKYPSGNNIYVKKSFSDNWHNAHHLTKNYLYHIKEDSKLHKLNIQSNTEKKMNNENKKDITFGDLKIGQYFTTASRGSCFQKIAGDDTFFNVKYVEQIGLEDCKSSFRNNTIVTVINKVHADDSENKKEYFIQTTFKDLAVGDIFKYPHYKTIYTKIGIGTKINNVKVVNEEKYHVIEDDSEILKLTILYQKL